MSEFLIILLWCIRMACVWSIFVFVLTVLQFKYGRMCAAKLVARALVVFASIYRSNCNCNGAIFLSASRIVANDDDDAVDNYIRLYNISTCTIIIAQDTYR